MTVLIAAMGANQITFYNITSGKETSSFTFSDLEDEEHISYAYQKPPTHASFSLVLGLLGVAYRSRLQ